MTRTRFACLTILAFLAAMGSRFTDADERDDFFESKIRAVPADSGRVQIEKHWAFEPLGGVSPPQVQDRGWLQSSVDAYIRSRQEAAGVRPVARADKPTFIRRATFDLTGLPPTPQELEAFFRDTSPRAFETVVERLLQSPAYGERWGRHWLDVVRYADTAGETADYPVPHAWRYRNYVIDSFNADKPYDEFLREQIAGDIMATDGPRELYAERVTATGYLAIARRFGFDSENYHHLTIQDTIDTLGQTVLGMSLGCARCHDHKFDAISMRDYYGLYGIFDSSRYSFPGSEQKQKVRSLVPLVPPVESQPAWRAFDWRTAALTGVVTRGKQRMPGAVLRSLADLDGDFELQAPAAGGSHGVLVQPWHYAGSVSVSASAQSPFKNMYPAGKVGVAVPAGSGEYRIEQAIHPRRTRENCSMLHLNLDFRLHATPTSSPRAHRLALGHGGSPRAVELFFAPNTISIRHGDSIEPIGDLIPGEWHNLQLTVNMKSGSLSGKFGRPNATREFAGISLPGAWSGVIDFVQFDSTGPADAAQPAIEFDNLGVQETAIRPVSTEPPNADTASEAAATSLAAELQSVVGLDGDLELQAENASPVSPWNPGPNSVVRVSRGSQSPFGNVYPPGSLGLHMPNRADYDGFGLALSELKPGEDGRLVVSFDFRCASQAAGGNGTWRYYLGHGPGSSAAVELYFNGGEFFRRSGDVRVQVCPLVIGQWYQVQMTLDLKTKSYAGVLASRLGKIDFDGDFASGWDGSIDYTFIDSSGHISGVRPSLDADNFAVGVKELPSIDAPGEVAGQSGELRRGRVAELRRQLAAIQASDENKKRELDMLLNEGPVAMAYGMFEGTPHDVRLQMRGDPARLGEEVRRGFVQVLGGAPLPAGTPGSGRMQLADWLTRTESPAKALAARVMVNRIWLHHFGRGIVKTPNDFGVRGIPPTHPELLDHLAQQFIQSGWSVKAMHRLIMYSATYQQSTEVELQPAGGSMPDNPDLYVAFPRRRLSAEEIRDSILAVSGELDRAPAREHPFPPPTGWGFTQHAPFNTIYDHNKRSVYLMVQRLKRHPFLSLFDGADPNATTAERATTTVPTQALFFLNDPFVHAKADAWSNHLLAVGDESQRVELVWRHALGRSPTEVERAEASEFFAAYRNELTAAKMGNSEAAVLAAYLRTLFSSNEFLHVD